MNFTGNGITNCYPDEVEDFISITVLKNRFRQSRSIKLVTERLIRFEMDRLFGRQDIEESVDRTYSVPGKAYLRDEVEKAVSRLGEYPVDEVYKLIEFREGRRSKQVELLVVFMAALVGGIVGSILTWLLGWVWLFFVDRFSPCS